MRPVESIILDSRSSSHFTLYIYRYLMNRAHKSQADRGLTYAFERVREPRGGILVEARHIQPKNKLVVQA